MLKILSERENRHYREEGYCFPTPVLSATEVDENRVQLECFECGEGHPVPEWDFDADGVAFHTRATDELRDILFAGAEKVRPTL